MSKILHSVEEIIGKTPLLEVTNIEKNNPDIQATILAKLEYLNPAGSTKDRAAKQMLDDAVKEGKVNKDTVIIEPTSGNTGIGLACIGATRGYHTIIVMPDTMSVERIKTMAAYGAEVVLSEGSKGMSGAIEKANELAKQYPSSFIPGQFDNPSNAKAHYLTTGPEVWQDSDGQVDYFVAGVGTGGTITGVGHFLKEKNPNVKIIAIEPFNSPVLSTGKSGHHNLQGIGANFVPKVLDTKVIDEIISVKEEDAYQTGRMLGKTEGILCGISSGAALWAAIQIGKRPENKGKKIVVLLPDTGDRYLSTEMFQ